MHVDVYFLAALGGVATVVWELTKTIINRHEKSIKDTVLDAIKDLRITAIEPILLDVALLKGQVADLRLTDSWWRKSAMDSVTILHHPEPSRNRVDQLLDVFRAGTITKSEKQELKAYLLAIIDHEEGSSPAPFKVFPGEQVAASILLHTIDHITEGEDA